MPLLTCFGCSNIRYGPSETNKSVVLVVQGVTCCHSSHPHVKHVTTGPSCGPSVDVTDPPRPLRRPHLRLRLQRSRPVRSPVRPLRSRLRGPRAMSVHSVLQVNQTIHFKSLTSWKNPLNPSYHLIHMSKHLSSKSLDTADTLNDLVSIYACSRISPVFRCLFYFLCGSITRFLFLRFP